MHGRARLDHACKNVFHNVSFSVLILVRLFYFSLKTRRLGLV